MALTKKIEVLENYLAQPSQICRVMFKTDIYLFFNKEFTPKNSSLNFLNILDTQTKIEKWVDHVTSRVVLKFDEGEELLGLFIDAFVEHN